MIVPILKPALSTSSLSVAARPGTVVPLSTATVTLPGWTAPPCFCLLWPESLLPLSTAAAPPVLEPSSSPVSWVTPYAAAPPRTSRPARTIAR